MQVALIIILFIITLAPMGWYILRYLQGDFTIASVEEIKRDTYKVTIRDQYAPITGEWIKKGEEIRIVQKITYKSGRVVYKSFTLKS